MRQLPNYVKIKAMVVAKLMELMNPIYTRGPGWNPVIGNFFAEEIFNVNCAKNKNE